MNLNDFLYGGIKNIMGTAGRFYMSSFAGQKFMANAVSSMRTGAKIRDRYEKDGTHIPAFLIASVAANCNLRCAGCYARANGACSSKESENQSQMDVTQWRRLFSQASQLGVSFILLAGGEPLLRRDVVEAAADYPNILFPIFTNGTVMDERYITLFDAHRNLIPVFSIEGEDRQTDARRGQGISEIIWKNAVRLQGKGLLYGTSITVTSENMLNVTTPGYVNSLKERGCGLVFYVEYVPAEEHTEHLMLNDADMAVLRQRIDVLRADKENRGMIMLSFPGDEEAMGGCLAAGRGFFHISPSGDAEPCPFSPFSTVSLKDQTLLDVLHSPFFERVRQISAAEALNHQGGCTLFQHEDEVTAALNSNRTIA